MTGLLDRRDMDKQTAFGAAVAAMMPCLSELNRRGSCALFLSNRRDIMDIKEHMEVIGADGVHVGTVDRMEGKRIKLTKKDSGEGAHKGHHHFIDTSLIAEVEGNRVRLSANADVAVTMEQEK
jgi:hypothetical protein